MEKEEINKKRNQDEPKTHDEVIKLLDEIRSMEENLLDTEIIIEPINQDLDAIEIPVEPEISKEKITSDERIASKDIESQEKTPSEKHRKKGFLYRLKQIKIKKPNYKKLSDLKKKDKKKLLSKFLSKKSRSSARTTFTLKLDETGNLIGFSIKKPIEHKWHLPFIKSQETSSEESTGKIKQILSKIKPVISKIKGVLPHR